MQDKFSEEKSFYFGAEQSIEAIANCLREQGPFDGVLGFSQGSIIWRNFYAITQYEDKETFKDLVMPRFLLSFGGPFFPNMRVAYKGKQYKITDYIIPMYSMHITGEKDEYIHFNLLEA